ncbi:hypothetical protein HY218_00635 [Candidatus Saccharibacteria bacterium]|nr:hypothetical protein [Candidatus Saccharibacteria bacterium]
MNKSLESQLVTSNRKITLDGIIEMIMESLRARLVEDNAQALAPFKHFFGDAIVRLVIIVFTEGDITDYVISIDNGYGVAP